MICPHCGAEIPEKSESIEEKLRPKKPLRVDARGNVIPWDAEHDYFMAFDPENPDLPTD